MVRTLDVVVPVWNEGKGIYPMLDALQAEVSDPFRVIIGYDHEDDSTLAAVQSYPGSDTMEIVCRRNEGTGPHGAVMTGLRYSDASAVVVMPADDDYNAGIIDEMVRLCVEDGCDVVCADRFVPGGCMEGCPWLKATLVYAAAFLLHHVARLPVRDATNGFRLFSRRAIREIEIESSEGFTYSLEYLVKAYRMGWRIGQIPARWFERKRGSSRFRLLRWVPGYLRWLLYAFATPLMRKGAGTARRDSGRDARVAR